MAIDQRDVSSTLRFMDDRALQQYAAMHKNDPYIFPLAFQESQNRQKMRMSQQGAQGMQPQPKVADQALAQMMPQPMPEEQGIGALAAPNMQTMADGGIAGYEGYDEGGSDFGQGPVVMMAEGGHVPRYQGNPRDGSLVRMPYGGDTMGMPSFAQSELANQAADLAAIDRKNAPTVAKIAELRQRAEALQSIAPELIPAVNEQIAALTASISPSAAPKQAPFKGTMPEPGYTYRGMENDPRLDTPRTTPKMDPKVDPTRRNTADPSATRKDPAPTAAAAAAAAAATEPSEKTETGGLDSLMAEYERKQSLARNTARNADVQYASSLKNEGEKLVADEEKRIKDQVDPFKAREVRLLKQEKDLEKMPDKYLGIALFKAGAQMMLTPGKFNLGKVLGAGINAGSESYVQGMEKIGAARNKFAEAQDRLDDLRLNRADMNERDIKDARKEARALERQAEGLFYTGAREDLKMTNEGITKLLGLAADRVKTKDQQAFDAGETDKRLKSAKTIAAIGENRADARANAPTPDMREAMLLGTGNTPEEKYFNGLKVKKELLGDKQGTQLFKMFLEENGRREKNAEKPLTLDQFRRTSAAFFAPPAPVDTTKPTRP